MRRWNHEIAAAILRRRAAMTRAVLPQLPPEARRLVTGERLDEGDRAPSLEDEAAAPEGEFTWHAPPPLPAAVGGA